MIAELSLADASRRHWDVVIVGTSFAAMFFARGLPEHLRVLFVEKGRIESHADQLTLRPGAMEDFAMENRSGAAKIWVANSLFGGNSNCWWGQTPRMLPSDFRLQTLYGQGLDWPIGYDDLEPYYGEVEDLMEVSGGGTDAILPRSQPFPFPPHIPSRSDVICRRDRPDIWFAMPSARSNGGNRPTCCGNGVCSLCPIDAKFTILNGIASFTRGGIAMVTGAEVRQVDIAAGAVQAVLVRSPDGTETRIAADRVALGANAIFNAAILLRSGLTGPALGRYLNEQTSVTLEVDVAVPNYFGGTSITGCCYGLYDGPHRSQRAAVLVGNFNAPAGLRHEPGRWTERMKIKFIAEDLPQADNRVELAIDGSVHLSWVGHSDYAFAGLAAAKNNLGEILPFAIERVVSETSAATEAHIQGTHRMGNDPTTSVVDGQLRYHGVAGLFALGSGAFPSCPPANPTLTLSALSLRAGRLA